MNKWEDEVRKSLASKKTGATLTKQDQALVNAQLVKEAKIREHVNKVAAQLRRGLRIIQHLISGNIIEFREYVSPTADLLIKGGALAEGSRLVGRESFETYLVRYFAT
jgi:FAD synthase